MKSLPFTLLFFAKPGNFGCITNLFILGGPFFFFSDLSSLAAVLQLAGKDDLKLLILDK